MKRCPSVMLVATTVVALFVSQLGAASPAAEPIDPVRGRELMQKFNRGETLTPEEQAYLERVREEIRRRQAAKKVGATKGGGPAAEMSVNHADWSALVPLTDMIAPYKGEDGGLYGGGKNEPPAAHLAAYRKQSEGIVPRNAKGQPTADGKIGLITLGFSNTSIESEDFKRTADADPQKAPSVVIVNGAIGSRSAVMWAWDGEQFLPKAEQERLDHEMDVVHMVKKNRKSSPNLDRDTWPTLLKRIQSAGLTPEQVQVGWLKQVEANPKPLGEFPAHARALQADMTAMLNIAQHYFPNLRVVYVSSRTYGGWSGRDSGSPEPYAYESGFATRWLIQSQIRGDAALNYDPARGDVKAPLVLWGPYFWAQGDTPRKFDRLTWTLADVRADRLHPSESGVGKTTKLLLERFKTDSVARRWFVTGQAAATAR